MFSSDGRQLAYPAQRDRQWVVVHNDRESPPWDGIGELLFSPDGRHLAYVAQRGAKWHVGVGAQVDGAVDAVFAGTLTFAHDGRRLAYAAQLGVAAIVVVDGRRGPPFSVFGGRKGRGGYDSIAGLAISPDGPTVAFAAQQGPTAFVVVGHDEGPRYDGIHTATIAFAANGMLTYVARQAKHYRVVASSVEGPVFDGVERPVIAAGRWGYLARRNQRYDAVVEGAVQAMSPSTT